MKRIRLIVAYDGTDFHGFQQQPGKRTVEGILNESLSLLTGEEIRVIGASRTDGGVHARGNVAVFDTAASIPPERFFMALNTKLPPDVRIAGSEEVEAGWNPHAKEQIKTYSYRICNARVYDPVSVRYVFPFVRKLNLAAMKQAAEMLVGEHDFTSFANPASQVLMNGGSAVRRIESIEISSSAACAEGSCFESSRNPGGSPFGTGNFRAEDAETENRDRNGAWKAEIRQEKAYLGNVTILVSGNGFLYNMVRIIAGTLLEVGTGRFAPEDMKRILEARDRTKAGLTAPPQGLCLEKIRYF